MSDLMERRRRLLGPNVSTFYDEPVHIVDWMPTLAAMVDYTPAEDPKWDGMDISPLIHQADSLGSRPLYWLWRNALPTNDCRWAMRQGDWKIVSAKLG